MIRSIDKKELDLLYKENIKTVNTLSKEPVSGMRVCPRMPFLSYLLTFVKRITYLSHRGCTLFS